MGTFEEVFKAFSKFGDRKSTGTHITLSQSDKWMKQAKIIDGKKLNTTDTSICFKKFKALKINISDYEKFINDLAKTKNLNADNILEKMTECGQPALSNVVVSKPTPTIERLTDVSKYTGIHKERFDESGKGKGIEGREDVVDNSGYVNGFKANESINKK